MIKGSSILANIDWKATPKEVFADDTVAPGKCVCFIDLSDFYPEVKTILLKVGKVSYEVLSVYSDIPDSMVENALFEELNLPLAQRHSWGGWYPVSKEIKEFIKRKVKNAVRLDEHIKNS